MSIAKAIHNPNRNCNQVLEYATQLGAHDVLIGKDGEVIRGANTGTLAGPLKVLTGTNCRSGFLPRNFQSKIWARQHCHLRLRHTHDLGNYLAHPQPSFRLQPLHEAH